jgi:hypothetical protein
MAARIARSDRTAEGESLALRRLSPTRQGMREGLVLGRLRERDGVVFQQATLA